ncbi:MAG: hypothetical protein U0324_17695 [Polyangiales bacterium]
MAQVPTALDQVPRTVLDLARAAAPDKVVAIDTALRASGGYAEAIHLLDRALRDRKVVVERVERFATDLGTKIPRSTSRDDISRTG